MNTRTLIGLTTAGMALLALTLRKRPTIPAGATAVTDFDLNRYLGQWYEIARFDFRFEEHMNNTTAAYGRRKDGLVKVTNRGYDKEVKRWKKSVGKAKFRGEETVGALEVSFFGPFYAPYNVIALEGDYQYALIAGKSTDYLWLLLRDKTMPDDVRERFLAQATEIGYDTERLLWPAHDMDNPQL